MNPSDFRSDTVTQPTPEMRKAMAEAEVGDDVIGFDPTVQKLEALAAETMGKEAGLFCPSGTMGNSIAVKAWTQELQEVIVESRSHIFNLESTHLTFISRVTPRPLPSRRGAMDPAEVEHRQDIGIVQFIQEGESDDVEGVERRPVFQGKQRNPGRPERVLHVRPRGEDTLGPKIGPGVENIVKDFLPRVRHPDFINIGKGQGDGDARPGGILADGVPFPAGVAAGFFDPGEEALRVKHSRTAAS